MTDKNLVCSSVPESDVSFVTFVITGHDLDPEKITELFAVSPDQSWKRGEKKVFKSGREHMYAWGGWKLFQSKDTLNAPLENQLEYWAQFLTEKATSLEQLSELNCNAVLSCYLSISETARISLEAKLLEKIARNRVGIELNCFAGSD